MVSFQRLIEKKTTILFDVSAIVFFNITSLLINAFFYNITYSMSATFFEVNECIKISPTERNLPIY